MIIRTEIFLMGLILLLNSCENREWANPFDPDCPKEIYTPSSFHAKQEGNVVKLSWTQYNTFITGFIIEKSVENGVWTTATKLSKSELTWIDTDITGGKEHKYKIYAIAGNNGSNESTTSITPILAAKIMTLPIKKILSTSAIVGGDIASDGGSPIQERGVCWSDMPSPTIFDSKTSDGHGIGIFESSVSGLNPSTKYFLRAYATTGFGTSYGNEISFHTSYGEITDIDGNIYPTVKIGNQIWMAENLKVTHYYDGTPITNASDNSEWTSLTVGAYCIYDNDSSSFRETFGALYNWYAVNSNKLAPDGWHVPTNDEWEILINYLGGENIVGGKLKEMGTSHWNTPNEGATNESGFTALPGGFRDGENGQFSEIKQNGYWWTLNTDVELHTIALNLIYDSETLKRFSPQKSNGNSVRCIMGTLKPPTMETTEISNLTSNSVTSGGTIISDGGSEVTSRGVCWSTNLEPTIADNTTYDGIGSGSFTSNISGLNANTTYFLRAFATNIMGTGYGPTLSFTTKPPTASATVITFEVNTTTNTTATLGGAVLDDGNDFVFERGVCYCMGCSNLPSINDYKIISGSGIGEFQVIASGLQPNADYFYRAYAINNNGIYYGNTVPFYTLPSPRLATVFTSAAGEITASSAVLGGNVISDGYDTVTERGIAYSKTQNPTTSNSKIIVGSGKGTFNVIVSDLDPITK